MLASTSGTRASRRSALKASKAISNLANEAFSSAEEVDENASDLSGSLYEGESRASSTTDSEPSGSASLENSVSISESEENKSSKRGTGPRIPPSQARGSSVFINTARKPIKRSYASCPLYRFVNNSGERRVRSVKQTALDCFADSVKKIKSIYSNAAHPFAFIDGFTSKKEYDKRQSVLFPPSLYWKPYSFDDKSHCLPEPSMSPFIVRSNKENGTIGDCTVERFRRFEYDNEQHLLYVGGFVKAIAWSPPRVCLEQIGREDLNDFVYLAVATYPSPGTRVLYSDPVQSGSGLIQIWNCGRLTLSHPPQGLHPEPHLFIAHDWGLVMHMCWIPLPVTLAARSPKEMSQGSPCSIASISPSPLIHRTLGHLILACQDGFVRIISIPRFPLDPVFFRSKRKFPLYELNPKGVFKLSPCASKIPDWIGWPTQLHIRAQYPSRLFVAYSRGHVALYDLSCLNPLLFDSSTCHLSPVRLFRLINGPVRSMSLNPVNGRQLLVQGWDTNVRIWDTEDTVSNTLDSPEFQWGVSHGLAGASVLWHTRGDMIFSSRETFVTGRFVQSNLSDMITRSEGMVLQTLVEAPSENARHLIPLGIQCVTHLDFSDPLNTLVCATDHGRVELIVHSLDGRTRINPKVKYISQVRIPLCQWSLSDAHDENSDVDASNFVGIEKLQSVDDWYSRIVNSKCYLLPPSAAASTPMPTKSINFPDPDCPECQSVRSFCWHKLWGCCTLKLNREVGISSKPRVDFLKTPHLSVTQAAFYPYPQAATWLAMGTSFGFIHFHCADFLYLSEFDQMLNRPPQNISSCYLNNPNVPSSKSLHIPVAKLIRPREIRHPHLPTNGKRSAELRSCDRRTAECINLNPLNTDSGDSDATEPMDRKMPEIKLEECEGEESMTKTTVKLEESNNVYPDSWLDGSPDVRPDQTAPISPADSGI